MIGLEHERLLEVLDYDPATGHFRWKVRTSNRVKVGDLCANKDRHGYIRIRVDRKLYWAARLAWFYVNGCWPSADIDHINGVRDDNRMQNLREATRSQNLANRPGRRNGLKGVSFNKRNNKWLAQIGANGFLFYLGYFETEQEAHAAYARAAKEKHGTFARVS